MKKIKLFLFLSIFLAINISCVEQKPLTILDSGKTINFSMDDPFQVQLRSNASTGYEWVILPFDTTIVKLQGEPDFIADDNRIGSGGNLTYSFSTVGEGSTTIEMVYKRKWEKPMAEDKTFTLNVVCGTMGRILSE